MQDRSGLADVLFMLARWRGPEDTHLKRPDEFEKRLNTLVAKSAQGKPFGYGIEDYF